MSHPQNSRSVVHCPGCYDKLYYETDEQDPDSVIETHTMMVCKRPHPIVFGRAREQFGLSPIPSSTPAGKPRKGHGTNHVR